MRKNIVITGKPKSGKSTLLQRIIDDIPRKVGFVTHEVVEDGGRVGFEIETHLGEKELLAHVNFDSPYSVSKYSVRISNLESVLPKVATYGSDDFLYLDEVGQMQLFSRQFKELVLNYLNSPNTCLLAVSAVFEDDFTKALKERSDIILVEISPEDRGQKEKFLKELIKKVRKAKTYISEPDRFTVRGTNIEVRSEHGLRKLSLVGGVLKCDCQFYRRYGICSHAIAAESIAGSFPDSSSL